MRAIRFFILVVVMAIQLLGFAQNSIYRGRIGLPKQCSYVELTLGDSIYDMTLCFDFNDVYLSFMLSFGQQFKMDDGSLVLCDKQNGFQMLLEADGKNDYVLEKGFSAITPMRLTYCRDDAETFHMPEIDLDSVRGQKDHYKSQTQLRDFNCGLYEFIHPCVFQLEVLEDSSYLYFVNEMAVSEGIWKRQGNLVVFYDSCLGEAFSALVEDGYIVGTCFPGEYGNHRFRIIPKEEHDDIPFPLTPNKYYDPKITQEGCYLMEGNSKVTLTISNNYYALDIDDSFGDVVSYDRVSFGRCKREGDTLLLKDVLLNFSMKMVFADQNTLVFKRSFLALMGKSFVFQRQIAQRDWVNTIDDYENHLKNISVHWRADTTFVCDTGWYVWKDFSRHGTDIHLMKDGRFELTIEDDVYLSGEWGQAGNLIVFKDDIISEPFYAVLEEGGMIPFLPSILGLWKYQLYNEELVQPDLQTY